MRNHLALAFVLSACGRIDFGPRAGGDAQTGNDDAGAIATSCVAVAGGDDFSDGVPCMPWGTISTSTGTTMTEANGELIITPAPNQLAAFGYCQSSGKLAFTNAGIVVEVAATLPFGLTYFTITDGVTSTDMFYEAERNMIFVCADSSTAGMATFDPVAMRWWRIRPGAQGMLYETSPDASHWTMLTIGLGLTLAPTVTVAVEAYQPKAVMNPGSARFAGISICP